jgi:multidrug efflux pump subunit AcrB
MKRLPFKQAAIYAINEVGNPTILATFTVIAAILPMAFVSGMMGPYMSPMPIGASIAMILSLFVALTVTLFRISFITRKRRSKAKDAEGLETSQVYKIYNRLERPLLERHEEKSTCGVTVLLLIGSVAMFSPNLF